MKVPRHTVATALMQRPLTSANAKHFASEIAAYLLSEHRAAELDSLVRDMLQYRADRGSVEVTAISAFPLTDQVRADITAETRNLYPEAHDIIISHRLDRSVVGGVKLEFANQQLDLSIRTKLNRLKQLTAHTR